MSQVRIYSTPEFVTSPISHSERQEDFGLEGVSTSVKLLLKLIHDHNEASTRDVDDRKMQRTAGMMSILDDVKTRIQKFQSCGKKRVAELRRCNTDLRRDDPSRERSSNEAVTDLKARLRKELNVALEARKGLEMMCSSLGKEKVIMASEIFKKVQELNGMEEHLNDLRAQNQKLLAKVQVCAAKHKNIKSSVGEMQKTAALRERNRLLSKQLLRSLDGYKVLKRRLQEAQGENTVLHATIEEMGMEVATGLEELRDFRKRTSTGNEESVDMEEVISVLETLKCFEMKILKHRQHISDCVIPKGDLSTSEAVLG